VLPLNFQNRYRILLTEIALGAFFLNTLNVLGPQSTHLIAFIVSLNKRNNFVVTQLQVATGTAKLLFFLMQS
jgi:hypothetical protein